MHQGASRQRHKLSRLGVFSQALIAELNDVIKSPQTRVPHWLEPLPAPGTIGADRSLTACAIIAESSPLCSPRLPRVPGTARDDTTANMPSTYKVVYQIVFHHLWAVAGGNPNG